VRRDRGTRSTLSKPQIYDVGGRERETTVPGWSPSEEGETASGVVNLCSRFCCQYDLRRVTRRVISLFLAFFYIPG